MKTVVFRLLGFVQRTASAERSTLFAAALALVSLFGFVKIAEEMIEGGTEKFDTFVLLAFRDPSDVSDPIGPQWLETIMRDFTALGGIAVLTAITAIAVGYLFLIRKHHAAWMVVLSIVGGILLSNLLKWSFSRPRPDLVPHGTDVYTLSFPSGHAMLSAIVYLTLGALLARTQADPRVKVYLLCCAGVLAFIVGISRIYLGVHWPTDVLAGWAVGAGWALLCWVVMVWLQGKGKVEQANGTLSENRQ
ncbi:phosphatase PAP2 family protein [Noviherbaspirillum agri]